VLLSHDHYDHLDRSTIHALAATEAPFVTSLGVGGHLERWGVPAGRITELDWWDTAQVSGVTVTATPAQHFSGRGLKDRNTTLWSSFHLQGASRSFFYGADTGLTAEYQDIARRLGPFDMVALEIGAYHPSWGDIHLGPDNALAAYAMLGSGVLLPIHWGTFTLGLHPWDEPVETLHRNAEGVGVPAVFPRLGEPVEPGRDSLLRPWWRDVASGAGRLSRRRARADDAATLEWMTD
jgi:L-ascorbate metabolism protein UlaG (beta-lactamase superfamily)